MIQKLSRLKVADNSGAKEVMVINVLSRRKGNSYQRFGTVGELVVCSVKQALPDSKLRKGDVVYGVIVRARKEVRRYDGTYIRFDDNAVVLIGKENKNPLGSRVFGPIAREVKDIGYNKIASLAPEVL
ncbi:50S ribosomal protein L14 [Candidatus Dojkabacteria bacterium]|uniref:Large ribosomal subunit protein uL14 n=1 Tax=Candidatus Dojkabacteria bacterium TaxID=2099670 RepID=A0A955L895_9BACT|nr:50S ribosomal protein L14 [Candidatus Dojkabacteria bacterium]